MSIEIKIVIPSMGRADRVHATKAIKNATLCVPESDAKAYAEHNPGVPILTHPDSLLGLTRKRQFILEKCGNHYQIDDDIKYIQRLYTESGEENKLDADEAYDVIQYIGNCCKLAGCYLFGLNKDKNPLAYNEFSPIGLTGIINGSVGFIEGSKLYYNPRAVLSEDYWMAGLNAYIYRMCWIDKRFGEVATAYAATTGGCASYRTVEQEKQDTLFLRQCFGEAIQIKKDTALAKRKMEFQRSIKIPF